MNNLLTLRKELNLTQEEMSKKLNLGRCTYGNYEIERTDPSIDILIKLADFFECSIDYLVGRSNELDTVIIQNDISSDERELINVYKMLDYSLKAKLIGYAYGLKEQIR